MLTVLGLAVALGVDAFSLAIGVGMRGVSWGENVKISGTIGVMHIIMPLIGYYLGSITGQVFGEVAQYAGGAILLFLGIMMIRNGLKGNTEEGFHFDQTTTVGLLTLATGVSLDALSVGFSLGTLGYDLWMTLITLGIVSGIMTALGLLLGDRVGGWFDQRAEIIGGAILLILSGTIFYDLLTASAFSIL